MATTIILYIIGVVIGWVILYYVVKAAVRNGVTEALDSRSDNKNAPLYMVRREPERPASPAQLQLQQRYEKGEISFEVYQAEWNKLNA